MADTTQPSAETLELIAELAPLVAKASHPNGWEWMFPLRVVPVDGKPTIVSHKGGNLFRGYIATWDEADLLVALANAAPRILAALTGRAGDDAIPAGEVFAPPRFVIEQAELDDDCGCPEETWGTPYGSLNMHLSAGEPSNAHLDNGDEGEWEVTMTLGTVAEARAAFFGWAVGLMTNPEAHAAGDAGAVRWRERWYGSDPQRGSAIVDEAGNVIAYFGGDEETHRATTAVVAAHNAALATPKPPIGGAHG